METNESIVTREVVAIDDRKKLGKIKGLCVDCDTRAVSYYVVSSATTNSSLALPFEKSIAVGDTFMTIQSREDFLPSSAPEAKGAINEGFRLVGTEVFSKAGNRLGVVDSYEFDAIYGTVTKIILGKRNAFEAKTFIFFSPEFVFVDDGESTAYDVRHGAKDKRKVGAKVAFKARRPKKITGTEPVPSDAKSEVFKETPVSAAKKVSAPVEKKEKPIEQKTEAVKEVSTAALPNDEDAVLKEFLIGAKLVDNVISKDGAFEAAKGTELTAEIIEEAQAHDALLLLTMSVEA